MQNKLNFTVGPVQIAESIRNIGANQVPYFRTDEFSNVMFENENLIKEMAYASEDSKTVFITGSGTASMEAVIINTITDEDKILVINGGSFGHRFIEICDCYGFNHTDINLKVGESLKKKHLDKYENEKYTVFLVNLCETSTGVLYDINLISNFCKRNNMFLIVDAISSFISDDVNMIKHNVDVLITGSQKALACPPGVSIILLSKRSQNRIMKNKNQCYYLNLKFALENMKRGQTPFTPAVSILLQINKRLNEIKENGGVLAERKRISHIANDFRNKITAFPFKIISESLSNTVTPLYVHNNKAYEIFLTLKNEYNIWVCPNGGDLREIIFRVGHIGNLNIEDNDILINALHNIIK